METAIKTKVHVRKKTAAVRASISFPAAVYKALESIARGKNVSLAWVVREASENQIAETKSLLEKVRQ